MYILDKILLLIIVHELIFIILCYLKSYIEPSMVTYVINIDQIICSKHYLPVKIRLSVCIILLKLTLIRGNLFLKHIIWFLVINVILVILDIIITIITFLICFPFYLVSISGEFDENQYVIYFLLIISNYSVN